MKISDVLKRTDWALLSQQKLELLRIEASWSDGLLNFIDEIQDAAERAGYPVVWLADGALPDTESGSH